MLETSNEFQVRVAKQLMELMQLLNGRMDAIQKQIELVMDADHKIHDNLQEQIIILKNQISNLNSKEVGLKGLIEAAEVEKLK